jgi:hypothetical protein
MVQCGCTNYSSATYIRHGGTYSRTRDYGTSGVCDTCFYADEFSDRSWHYDDSLFSI